MRCDAIICVTDLAHFKYLAPHMLCLFYTHVDFSKVIYAQARASVLPKKLEQWLVVAEHEHCILKLAVPH